MIAKPGPRQRPFDTSERKIAGIKRKQARERDALPLLAPLIAQQQPTPLQELDRYRTRWHQSQQNRRDELANVWRRARTRFYTLPADQRKLVRSSWNASPYPKTAYSFAGFIHSIETGKMSPGDQPWVNHAPVIYQRRPLTSFTDVFAPIPRPQRYDPAAPFNELPATFYGNIGHGLLVIEVNEPQSPRFLIKPLCEPIELIILRRLLAPLVSAPRIETYRFNNPAKEAEFRDHRRHLKAMSDRAQQTWKGPPQ